MLPSDLLARIAENDLSLGGLKPTDYHLNPGERLGEMVNRSWNRAMGAWAAFREALGKVAADDPATTITRERWLLILFSEFGFGRIQAARAVEINGKAYAVSHEWGRVPIHLVGARIDLDRRTGRVAGAARSSPHSLVQELLNASSDRVWGLVSNGLKLRLLRDNLALTRQAYVEFDLEAMMEGQVYPDFVLLCLLVHQSRFEAESASDSWLERWVREAEAQGTRALEHLRDAVERAIVSLGQGFLANRMNQRLRERLRTGTLSREDYYRLLLRLVYRLLFLFVAEDRGLLLIPQASAQTREVYSRYYSVDRLRRLAERHHGTRHFDLYESLKLVMVALNETGESRLALPPLGSFLWSAGAIGELGLSSIANRDFLAAISALVFTTQDKVRRPVDYKNLGAEELGSVYESLLELHPEMNLDAPSFSLTTAAGNERKTTGSYYTPTSLITSLLDTALDPVVQKALKQPEPEASILNLKVIDPACGSGHFLIAATHRLAKRLAAVRTGDDEPPPAAVRSALRDVAGRCIYGVDVNEMAVELCKVSLWIETLEPGKPLSFLDHHIVRGNSLLGTTPALLAAGIPDEAFEPIEGDDPVVARALKKRNRQERDRAERGTTQLTLDEQVARLVSSLAASAALVEAGSDESLLGLREKEKAFQAHVASDAYRRAKLLADAWCAAFILRKAKDVPGITHDTLRHLAEIPDAIPESVQTEVTRLADVYKVFHWHIEFPEVFSASLSNHGSGPVQGVAGFELVIGNPPWERLTIADEEWFARRDQLIAETRGKAPRDKLIRELALTNPALFEDYRRAKRDQELFAKLFSRAVGTYPLTGFRELNTYHLFAELAERLTAPSGRVGMIVKTGIVAADNCLPFIKRLTDRRQLVGLLDFVNTRGLFPTVQTVERFSLLTFTGMNGHTSPIRLATLCQDVSDLAVPDRVYSLSPEDIALMSPLNGAVPLLKGSGDAGIMRRLYNAFQILGRSDPSRADQFWNVDYAAIFHMANDSKHFQRLEDLEAAGLVVNRDRRVQTKDDEYWPLYEGKYIFLLEHRYGSFEGGGQAKKYGRKAAASRPSKEQLQNPDYEILPRYWFPKSLWLHRAAEKGLRTDYQFLFRNIAGVYPDLRTAIGAICPAGPANNGVPTLITPRTDDPAKDARRQLAFAALFCSVPFDYVVRNKLFSKDLTLNTLGQIPLPPPHLVVPQAGERGTLRARLVDCALELTFTSNLLKPLGTALGIKHPFVWDEERRFLLYREIDALAAHFYGLSRNEFAHMLSTFETLRSDEMRKYGEYRTCRVDLDAFDRILQARSLSLPYRPLLDPPRTDPGAVSAQLG